MAFYFIILISSIKMNEGFNDEISPWDHDPHHNIFTIQYEEQRSLVMKKLSSPGPHRSTTIKHKHKKKQEGKERLALKLHGNHYSMKNYIAHSLSAKSQQELILFRAERLKGHQLYGHKEKAGHKSTIFEIERRKDSESLRPSDFAIRKYDRMRKYSKAMFKEVKVDDIFRKIQEIQNPSQRQNISLPKIQIKI